MSELGMKLEGVTNELAVSESTLAVRNAEFSALQNNLKELEELREMREVHVLFSLKIFPMCVGVGYKFAKILEGNVTFVSSWHRISLVESISTC